MKARIEDGVVYSPYPSVNIPACSFYELAREKLLTNPEKTALVDDGVSFTRAEVLALMQRYAIGFRQHGVRPGDRVCLHLKNSATNLIAMYGCVLAGATIILAKTPLTEGELQYQAQDSDSKHILTDEECAEKARNAAANLAIKGLFCMGRAAGFVCATDFSALDEREFQESPVADPRNSVLAVCYTSGSTGLPKGAEVSHYGYVASFYTSRVHLPWGDHDVLLSQSPIMHQSGMLYTALGLLDGAKCVVTTPFVRPLDIMDTIDKYKATGAVFLPIQLQALVREMQRTGRGLPTMRGIVLSGNVLPESVAKATCETFVGIENLMNVYAMTESCGVVAAPPKTAKPGIGTDVGFPATMVEIKVVDAVTRKKLGPHKTGEICFRSESMVTGYYKMPEQTAQLIDKEGWCKSGDAGYYDEDGRLYIVDRLKQMIKCMAHQVVPAELEVLLLREHVAEVAEVSVVGLPHPELGEAPAAAVVLTEEGSRHDRSRLAERIKRTVERNLAVHKHLYGGVYFMKSLPKTTTDKINRPALASFLAGAQQSVTTQTTAGRATFD